MRRGINRQRRTAPATEKRNRLANCAACFLFLLFLTLFEGEALKIRQRQRRPIRRAPEILRPIRQRGEIRHRSGGAVPGSVRRKPTQSELEVQEVAKQQKHKKHKKRHNAQEVKEGQEVQAENVLQTGARCDSIK